MTFVPPDAGDHAASDPEFIPEAPLAIEVDPLDMLRAAAPQIMTMRQQMWENGFRPVAIQTPVPGESKSGKAPAGKNWPARARKNPPEAATAPVSIGALNTGALADGLRAVDIDIDNPELAARIETMALKHFGMTIVRGRHNSPRRLLVYRAAIGEPGKRKLSGALGSIEVLGCGQQFVTDGVHGSGAWLQWGKDRGPWNTLRDDLTAISERQIDTFFADCQVLLGVISDEDKPKFPSFGNETTGTANRSARAASDFLGDIGHSGPPPAYSPEVQSNIAAALKFIPADDRDSLWLRVGMALHSLTTADGWGEWPRNAWDQWSRSYPKGFNEAGQDKAWASFKPMPPGQGIGIGSIYKLAQKRGWNGPTQSDTPAPPAGPVAGAALIAEAAPGGHSRLAETDIANSGRLIDMHGADLRYTAEWGAWVIWDEAKGVWVRDTAGEIVRRAKKVSLIVVAETTTLDGDAWTRRARWARESAMDAKINAMIRLAKAEPGVTVPATAFDSDPWLLGVQNGVVDLRRGSCGVFRRGCREDVITKQAGVQFDTEARCPNWLAFLHVIFGGNADVIAFIQRACGYLLTGDVSEEVLFLMYGTGQNGKSTFRETLHDLLGDYAGVGPAMLLIETEKQRGATPEVVDLLGRRMVSVNETGEGDRLAEGRIKAITSTDTITARALYASPITFRPTHKLLVTTNHRPLVRGTDDGIWRRIHAIRFAQKIQNKDRHFRTRCLVPELPGILNWAIEGLRQWHIRHLDPPQQLRQAAEGYRHDMDTVGQFLDERCIMDPEAWTRRPDLYSAYKASAELAGIKPMSGPAFYARVQDRAGVHLVKNGEWGFKGISFRRSGPGSPLPHGGAAATGRITGNGHQIL
jgi:putative DNA primase/helicase